MNDSLQLTWASHAAVRFACQEWHYAKSTPCPPITAVAVFEDGQAVGVVVFSRGANRHLGSPFGLLSTEVCELARIALREHRTPVSRIVRIALAMLRQRCPGLKAVVSFSDPAHGHNGRGVYAAGGWLYLGTTAPTQVFKDAKGRAWHPRMVSASGRKRVFGRIRRVVRIDATERIALPGKHRYVMPLDDATRERLLPLSKPYPRRESSESGAPSHQLGTGALQCDLAAPSHQGRGERETGGLGSHSPQPSLQGLPGGGEQGDNYGDHSRNPVNPRRAGTTDTPGQDLVGHDDDREASKEDQPHDAQRHDGILVNRRQGSRRRASFSASNRSRAKRASVAGAAGAAHHNCREAPVSDGSDEFSDRQNPTEKAVSYGVSDQPELPIGAEYDSDGAAGGLAPDGSLAPGRPAPAGPEGS